ncbi:aldo/keto reductase [Acidothermus cellulolyticus 11B]|uniref:Aldo/keto reductase n=2 Tax=Acidothermus cellulolyticus TaxID=28049 RepID=A0LQY5_ACIC1|nr:aldo/keto reductase [Acidothermus cellulolyticus]ABK51845.1 aldo/keto reductase [Acidothermus cellulolyticus 11B]
MAEMTYRQLGASGLTVSTVGLGCNNIGRRLDKDATARLVDAALDAGITLFDTADVYGAEPGASEEILGDVLSGRRGQVVLATKFGKPMRGKVLPEPVARGSRRYIRAAVEGSLRRLRTDYIDLYQMHEPDPRTPIEETLQALHELVIEGKVRYIGSSNFAAWQIVDADWVARSAGTERFISAQNEYSLLRRDVEADVVPACEHLGVGLLPYYPLANGLLTGKYRRGERPSEGRLAEPGRESDLAAAPWDVIDALEDFAKRRGIGLLDVAIGGLAAQPAVASVIAGATRPEQVRANAQAGLWEPDAADLAELDQITGGFTGRSV